MGRTPKMARARADTKGFSRLRIVDLRTENYVVYKERERERERERKRESEMQCIKWPGAIGERYSGTLEWNIAAMT